MNLTKKLLFIIYGINLYKYFNKILIKFLLNKTDTEN